MRRFLGMSSGSEGGDSPPRSRRRSRRSSEKRESEERMRQMGQAQQELIDMNKKLLEESERRAKEMQQKIEEDSEEASRRRGMVMDKTEQSSERYDINLGTMGLVDRLEAHPAGKLLKNVVISNEPPPDRELNVTRLRRYKPQNDFSKLTLGSIPAFRLSEEYMELPITDAMTESQFSSLKNYVLVSDVFIHYVPLDSFFSVSSPVTFQLNDFRKVDNTTMREFPLTHSGGYNILMTLDYCVAKEDLKHLTLSISTSLASFRKDSAWAAVKVLLTISHMDFPVKANIQETMGVLHLADSDLADFVSDPRSSDGVITPQAFALLKQHYKRGEIENINLPRDDKKEVNVAKTTIGNDDGDKDVRDIMSELRQKHLENARKGAPRSAMKKSSQIPNSLNARVEDKDADSDDGLGAYPDLSPEESSSVIGSDVTVELPRNDVETRPSMRSVNFG